MATNFYGSGIQKFIFSQIITRRKFSFSLPEFAWSASSNCRTPIGPNFSYLQNSQNYCADNSDKCIHRWNRLRFVVCQRNGRETSPDTYHSRCKIVIRHTAADTGSTVLGCRGHVYIHCKRIPLNFSILLRLCPHIRHGTSCCTDRNRHRICGWRENLVS